MGFLSLLVVASMPVLQLLLVGSLGAFLASGRSSLLSGNVRRDLNKIVFAVFSPSLIFSSLADTVTFQDLISWWFMPVNIGITFLIGGTLGWVAVKILRPDRHLEGLIMASCAAGNLGNLMLMIIPAVCGEHGSPFGDESSCSDRGQSYVSLSMALGGIFIWTHAYSLMKRDAATYEKLKKEALPQTLADENLSAGLMDQARHDTENEELGKKQEDSHELPVSTESAHIKLPEQSITEPLLHSEKLGTSDPLWKKVLSTIHQLVDELLAPPTSAAIKLVGTPRSTVDSFLAEFIVDGRDLAMLLRSGLINYYDRLTLNCIIIHPSRIINRVNITGFFVGAIPWLKSLIVGSSAPLRVIQDSLELLGNGTLPCTTLILGGNLIKGLKKSSVKPSTLLAIALVRYAALPLSGIAVVKAAGALGFLPDDSLFRYVLLTQFTLPPAMAIGVMAQLFGVGQEESSVIFLWMYLIAALALTIWSTFFMYMIS